MASSTQPTSPTTNQSVPAVPTTDPLKISLVPNPATDPTSDEFRKVKSAGLNFQRAIESYCKEHGIDTQALGIQNLGESGNGLPQIRILVDAKGKLVRNIKEGGISVTLGDVSSARPVDIELNDDVAIAQLLSKLRLDKIDPDLTTADVAVRLQAWSKEAMSPSPSSPKPPPSNPSSNGPAKAPPLDPIRMQPEPARDPLVSPEEPLKFKDGSLTPNGETKAVFDLIPSGKLPSGIPLKEVGIIDLEAKDDHVEIVLAGAGLPGGPKELLHYPYAAKELRVRVTPEIAHLLHSEKDPDVIRSALDKAISKDGWGVGTMTDGVGPNRAPGARPGPAPGPGASFAPMSDLNQEGFKFKLLSGPLHRGIAGGQGEVFFFDQNGRELFISVDTLQRFGAITPQVAGWLRSDRALNDWARSAGIEAIQLLPEVPAEPDLRNGARERGKRDGVFAIIAQIDGQRMYMLGRQDSHPAGASPVATRNNDINYVVLGAALTRLYEIFKQRRFELDPATTRIAE